MRLSAASPCRALGHGILVETGSGDPVGDTPVLVLPGHAHPGYTTPWLAGQHGTAHHVAGLESVLWALNEAQSSLKWTHIDIWSRLSAFWLSFQANVARTKGFQRPQGT